MGYDSHWAAIRSGFDPILKRKTLRRQKCSKTNYSRTKHKSENLWENFSILGQIEAGSGSWNLKTGAKYVFYSPSIRYSVCLSFDPHLLLCLLRSDHRYLAIDRRHNFYSSYCAVNTVLNNRKHCLFKKLYYFILIDDIFSFFKFSFSRFFYVLLK